MSQCYNCHPVRYLTVKNILTAKGFTLVETVVVVGIVFLLVGISFIGLIQYGDTKAVDAEALNVKTALEKARVLSVYAKDASAYGVHLESGKAVVFKGTTYSAGDPANLETVISAKASISSILLSGGGTDVLFSRLTGETSQSGAVTVSLKKDSQVKKVITISKTGSVNL